jgi:hypothetical protein
MIPFQDCTNLHRNLQNLRPKPLAAPPKPPTNKNSTKKPTPSKSLMTSITIESLDDTTFSEDSLSAEKNKENIHPNSTNLYNNENSSIKAPDQDPDSAQNQKNNAILNRISQAEASLNNFCNEVEQCQMSLKNLLKNNRSEITDNEFKFGKSIFGENNNLNITNDLDMTKEDEDRSYKGLSDLEKIKRELSFASATKEIASQSRGSEYSQETQSAKFYFSKSMKASPDKGSLGTGIGSSKFKKIDENFEGYGESAFEGNFFENNLKISDCSQISISKNYPTNNTYGDKSNNVIIDSSRSKTTVDMREGSN